MGIHVPKMALSRPVSVYRCGLGAKATYKRDKQSKCRRQRGQKTEICTEEQRHHAVPSPAGSLGSNASSPGGPGQSPRRLKVLLYSIS